MLKSLELFGFKSFADRVVFEFAPGITCVVGPNGSGKSNVVDAIKWILGDQSAKSLRGKEMSDVIFNGSAGRRASGFAEATLTFDNSAGLLPIDTAEVQVGRRLYQSGDSEYLLNRNAVRLKDIRDLFMGTGAGTAAYSIIEQGRVDQILQANPTTRRVVFEEAAGISKFKSRRVDAENRLERVAQNLLRLTDIVDQVESQLNATRSQASKAAKYREVSTELKAAWTGLAADDCRMLSQRLDAQLDEAEIIGEQLTRCQQAGEEIEAEKGEAERRLNQLDDEIHARERTISTARESIASSESTLRHQRQRRGELEADLQRTRQQRLSLGRQLELASSELSTTTDQLAGLERQLQTSQDQLAERESSLTELETLVTGRKTEVEDRRRQLSTLQKQRLRLSERLAALNSQAESLGQSQEQLLQRLDHLQDQLASAREKFTDSQSRLEQAEADLQTRQAQLTETQQSQLRVSLQREETDRQLQSLRERRSAAEARLIVLEELEQRQEGIAIGVREILRRAATSHYPPWNRILGTVRDLIDVPMDLAPIIDAALGERAQLLAISDLAPLMEYLNRGAPPIEGRVGFVSIAPMKPDAALIQSGTHSTEEEIDFTGRPGVYGRADRLVQERERAQGLARCVLGDTWLVENLDVARKLLEETTAALRIVTLQGEMLCQGPQLMVGTMPHESSIISRKSELRQLKNEIHQLQRGIEDATQRQAILSENIVHRSEEIELLAVELKTLSHAVTENATRLAGQTREVQRLEKEGQEQAHALDRLSLRRDEITLEIESARRELQDADEQSQSVRKELESEEHQIEGMQQIFSETQQAIRLERLELSQHAERLQTLKLTQARLSRDQQDRQKQLDELEQRAAAIRRTLQQSTFEMLHAESRIAELSLDLEEISRTSRTYLSERETLRQKRSVLLQKDSQQTQQRRQLVDRQHALNFDIEKQRMQLRSLAERIHDEYQISLEQLVESGVSAYQSFLEERYGTDVPHAGEVTTGPTEAAAGEPVSPLEESALVPSFEDVRGELEGRVDRLRRRLKMMGNVNTEALENLEELEERFNSLSQQLQDLQEAKAALENIIRRLNQESQRIFIETFETIRTHFRELFRKLFGGGAADIVLENPEDVLECGIDIVARPPGKELRSISLLSGGEKTMTAVALLFAMFRSKPSPYCILDEVDAALDEANVDRYVAVVKEFVSMTQFVVITHRKRTMTAADVIYGVTMEQAGISKRISVRFEDVRENGEIRTAA
jgi:chromosome segregation protein